MRIGGSLRTGAPCGEKKWGSEGQSSWQGRENKFALSAEEGHEEKNIKSGELSWRDVGRRSEKEKGLVGLRGLRGQFGGVAGAQLAGGQVERKAGQDDENAEEQAVHVQN